MDESTVTFTEQWSKLENGDVVLTRTPCFECGGECQGHVLGTLYWHGQIPFVKFKYDPSLPWF